LRKPRREEEIPTNARGPAGWFVALCAAGGGLLPAAEPVVPTETQQIEAAEAVRAQVDALFERYLAPVPHGERLELANQTAEAFAAIGAAAVPYLVSELEAERLVEVPF